MPRGESIGFAGLPALASEAVGGNSVGHKPPLNAGSLPKKRITLTQFCPGFCERVPKTPGQ